MSASQRLSGSLGEVRRAEQIEFSENVPANDGVVVERRVPFTGKHVELLVGAPAAANNKVGVQVEYQGDVKHPGNREDDFIALADTVHPFLLVFDVEGGTDITVRFENTSGNPHFLNVVSTVADFGGQP